MLYEVITILVLSRSSGPPEARLEFKDFFLFFCIAFIDEFDMLIGNFLNLILGFKSLIFGYVAILFQARITSYNVCYTKLLRHRNVGRLESVVPERTTDIV